MFTLGSATGQDNNLAATAIEGMSYQSGATHTSEGFRKIKTDVFTEADGMRPAADKIPRVLVPPSPPSPQPLATPFPSLCLTTPPPAHCRVVFVTDGASSRGYNAVAEAQILKQQTDAIVFSVGVGNYVVGELEAVASTPSTTFVFGLEWNKLVQSVKQVTEQVCTAVIAVEVAPEPDDTTGPLTSTADIVTCDHPADLLFLLDDSGSIGSQANWKLMTGFVAQIVEKFNIGPRIVDTRVGLTLFSDRAETVIRPNDHFDKDNLLAEINGLGWRRGGKTRVKRGLKELEKGQMTIRAGLRSASQGIARVIVLVTDGRANPSRQRGHKKAQELQKTTGAQIFTIGVQGYNK